MQRIPLLAVLLIALLLPGVVLAQSSLSTGFEPPAFVLGDVNGQGGWGHLGNSPTGGTIVPAPPGPPSGFGTQSLQLFTRAAANFGVANHLFSATVTDPAGESTSTIEGGPVAGPESTFQASFWFRTPTVPLISSRPDGRFAELDPSARGTSGGPGNRYAQVRLVNSTNTAAGVVRVEMGWYTTYPTFIVLPVANLAWGQWYRFDYRIELVDGLNGTASNDRFSLTIFDATGALLGTGCGSTWETGYRFGNFDAFNTPRGVNGFDFWSTSGPNLTVAGHIDGLSISTSTPPIVPLAVTVTGTSNVCAGGTTTLTANATGGTGTYTTYSWRDASNTVVGLAPALTAGAGTYTVTVTDSLCSTATSPPFVVNAFAPLAVTVGGNTNVCAGGTTTLTANASRGSGSITQFVWRDASNTVVGLAPTLPAGAGTYTVTVNDALCGTATSAPFTVNAFAPLLVTVSGTTNVCAGGTTTLTANATGGTGTYTAYSWRDASNTVVGSASTLTAGAGTYTITVTDSLCGTSTSLPFTVNAFAPLTVTVSGSTNVCAGATTTLTANATGGTGTYTTYSWRDASNTVVGAAPTLTAGAGTYTVTVTDSLCGTATSQPFTVNGFAPLVVTVSGNASVCFGATTTLTANASGGSGSITQFVWRDTANAIAGTGSTLVAGAGTFTVAATDASCGTVVSSPVTVQTTCTATPVVTWANPAPIVYGTALDGTQLNATASVPGTFVYTPPSGTVLPAGPNQVLSTTFTPTDTTNYGTVNASVLITVQRRPTATVINAIAPTPSTAGQPVTVSFAVTNTFGLFGGTVTVTDGTTSCSSPASAGSCTLTFLTAGPRTITASYSGDSNHLPSTSAARAHDVNREGAFAIVEGFGSVCPGASVTIRVHLFGTGPWTITWSDGLVETIASTSHQRVVQPSGPTSYSITSVRDQNGPGETAGQALITVNVVAAPLIENVPPVQPGGPATLRASAGYTLYQWFLGGVAIAGATSRELVINPGTGTNLGPYTVTGTRDGCTSAPSSAVTLIAGGVDADDAIIAVVGTTRGANGAVFRTTVHLTNPTSEPMAGEIRLIDPSLPVLAYTLAPGETQFIANVLPESFSGLTSANVRRTRGTLPTAVVHVFNDGGGSGNDGMIERIIPAGDALRAGERAVLLLPIDPVSTRFNVGLRSLLQGLVVRVQRRTVDGLLLATFHRTLPPSTLVHESIAAFTGAQAGSSESLTFEILSGSGVIYGAATDNGTNDPNLHIAARIESRTPSGRSILPVAGAVSGAFGSRFATGVQIHNPMPSAIIVALTFHPANRPASDFDFRRDVAISGGATLALDDVVAWLDGSGMVSVAIDTASSTRPILLARIYSIDRNGQTSATMVPVPQEGLLAAGQQGVLVAPRAHSESRFNIGVRTAASGVRMTATVRNAAGAVVRVAPLQFPPDFFAQSGATELLGFAFTSDESVVFAIEEGSAVIYGVWTDNRTQDPSLQYAVRP